MLFSTATPILSLTANGRAFQVSPKTLIGWGLSKLRNDDLDQHPEGCRCEAHKFEHLKNFQKAEREEGLAYEEWTSCLEDSDGIACLSDNEVVYWDNWFMNSFPEIYNYLENRSGPMFLISSLSQGPPACLGITMLAYLESAKEELTDPQQDWLYEFYTTNYDPSHDYLRIVLELAQVQ